MNKKGVPCDWNIAFLGLGSNIGDREGNLDSAIKLLSQVDGVNVLEVSTYIETAPVGYLEQTDFVNAVVKLCTKLKPHDLLYTCMRIEKELKRTRKIKWGPRTIDIDILLMGDLVFRDDILVIPHPHMHEREFVLKPLCEIAAEVVHPVYKKTIAEMFKELSTKQLP